MENYIQIFPGELDVKAAHLVAAEVHVEVVGVAPLETGQHPHLRTEK